MPRGLNRFPLKQETFELDVDAFAESAIRWRSDTAVVVTPNNPTAVSVSREDILHLARLLESHDCRLVVDESFIEFSRAGGSGSVEGDVAAYPNLVVIKSMSKVFGIAGLRLGYLLSADRAFVRRVRRSPADLERQRAGRGVPARRRQVPRGVRGELRVDPNDLPGVVHRPVRTSRARLRRAGRELRARPDDGSPPPRPPTSHAAFTSSTTS